MQGQIRTQKLPTGRRRKGDNLVPDAYIQYGSGGARFADIDRPLRRRITPTMTRENKVALVVGFALVLFVGILVSDHLSKAQTQRSANLAPAINTRTAAAGPPARFVDLRTPLPSRPPGPVPLSPQPVAARQAPPPTQVSPVEKPVFATPASERTYEVRSGESLSSICQQAYGTASLTAALAAHNGISDPDRLWAGRQLTLPPLHVLIEVPDDASPGGGDRADEPGTYRVIEGDSLSTIAQRFLGSADRWRQLYEFNRQAMSNPDTVRAGTVLKIPAG